MPNVTFHFDFISPYAYLAWNRWKDVAPKDVELEVVPVLLAGLLNAHGNIGPAEVEVKRRYAVRDITRKCARHNIPINIPPTHPFNPLLPLRVACAIEEDSVSRLVDRVFTAIWGEGLPMETSEQIAPLLHELGHNAEEVLKAAASPQVKQQLRLNTEQAAAGGIFGVPTFQFKDDLYWGNDSIECLLDAINGQPSPPQELLDAWDNIQVSAKRR